jgi:hypothetical protein
MIAVQKMLCRKDVSESMFAGSTPQRPTPESSRHYNEEVFIQPALGPRSGGKEPEKIRGPAAADLPARPSTAHGAGERPKRMPGFNDNVSASAAVGTYMGRPLGPSSGSDYDPPEKQNDAPGKNSMLTPLPDERQYHPGPMHTPMDDSIVITDEPTMDHSPECMLSFSNPSAPPMRLPCTWSKALFP